MAGKRNLRRLYTLTVQPEGPTGREMEQIAQEIVEAARDNVANILHRFVAKRPEILDTIEYVRRGTEIRVGIRADRPAGSSNISFYLVQKELREHVWLEPAVEEVMQRHKNVQVARAE